ncbi:g2965 [Coccomyxa elongata]
MRTAAGRRFFASAPEAVLEAPQSEVVQLASSAPVLVKFPDRAWGASAVLPQHLLPSQTGAAERVSVVRHAFAAHDAAHEPLADLVAPLGDGRVAVAHDASQAHRRLIVDEYSLGPSGQYLLQRTGTDLLRHLNAEGIRAVHVPDVAAAVAGAVNSARAAQRGVRQSTNEVLMVAPTAFGFNDQAAQDNHFMHSSTSTSSGKPGTSITHKALREFAGLHHELTEVAGVRVSLFQHSLEHGTPDAVFPNNWFTTHPAGEAAGGVAESTLALYPLKCPNRQMERRPDIVEVLKSRGYSRMWDLSGAEKDGHFFEGTGVLVLDRVNGIAYVNLSERADAGLAQQWADRMGYKELVTFRTVDPAGADVYHTNVMMAIGTDVAVVCLEAVPDAAERAHLRERLQRHHTVVEISFEQMGRMCGNILELEDGRGLPILAMSTQAHDAFTPEQRAVMRQHVAGLHHAPLDNIEYIGGGGVRCSLAELF